MDPYAWYINTHYCFHGIFLVFLGEVALPPTVRLILPLFTLKSAKFFENIK